MKQVTAIIRPEMLDVVRGALAKVDCPGITINDIIGQGTQKGITQTWRGEQYRVDLIPKAILNVVVRDNDVEKIVDAILNSAPTGEFGDGKIFISNIEEAIRIRTGQRGDAAL